MENKKITIPCYFEVSGETLKRIVKSQFQVTNQPIHRKIIEEGQITYGQTGQITQRNGPIITSVPNAKVIALKNGIIYDIDTTDENGYYTLYLENGEYDIRIEGNAYNRVIKGHKVENGIALFRRLIDQAQVKKRNLDIVEFSLFDQLTGYPIIDDGCRLVQGILLDHNCLPVKDAEIIVARSNDKQIHAFVKTCEDGKYEFVIDRQNFDVIIRSGKHHAKILRNHLFVPDKGFVPDIIDNTLIFKKGGEWLWTSK